MDDLEDTHQPNAKLENISNKLNAPKKVSQFEKARQEAEYKKLREEAEARQALKDFEDSFAEGDDDDDDDRDRENLDISRGFENDRTVPNISQSGSSNNYRRNEDRLGEQHEAAEPPAYLKRKRAVNDQADDRRGYRADVDNKGTWKMRNDIRGQLGGQDDVMTNLQGLQSRPHTNDASIRRPTMLLQNLPPIMTEIAIRRVMPSSLIIEDVQFLPMPRHRQTENRSRSALVVTAANTPASEVDKAVGQLHERYLGFGHYLKISRHVSSTGSLANIDLGVLNSVNRNPFGASIQSSNDERSGDRDDVLPSSFNRMAPPTSFAPIGPGQTRRVAAVPEVTVTIPTNIKLLRLIHETAESVIDYGVEFEALLMDNRDVQYDEKWAWLFDSSTPAGVYYRWLLWKCLSDEEDDSNLAFIRSLQLFDGGPTWNAPSDRLKYSNVTRLEDICDDDEYISSDEDSADEGTARRTRDQNNPNPLISIEGANTEKDGQYLNPYRRAKLTHLLARLPDNITNLRSGDIARISHFVNTNAGQGAEEIVDLLLCNVEDPFCHSVRYGDAENAENTLEDADVSKKRDRSNAHLVALYAISDVLLTSATSGIRDAWKYRTLFETAFPGRKIFDQLGRLEQDLKWGKFKSEQWNRKVGIVLDLWSSANVFSPDVQKQLAKSFLEPEPLPKTTQVERNAEDKSEIDNAIKLAIAPAQTSDESRISISIQGDSQIEALSIVNTDDDKKAEATRKIAALKARLAGNTTSSSDTAQMSDNQTTRNESQNEVIPSPVPVGTSRRARPTAEDLIDAPEEAPVMQSLSNKTGFGFSISLNNTNPQAALNNSDMDKTAPTFTFSKTETPNKPDVTIKSTKEQQSNISSLLADSDDDE